jgi:dCMP deaminase
VKDGFYYNCPRKKAGFKSGEGLEFCPAAHAERNVLINATRHGASLKGCTLYITSMTPCRECAKEIVNTGIIKVVYKEDSVYPENGITGMGILSKCGIEVVYLNNPS